MYDNGLLNVAKQVESSINEVVKASAEAVYERAKSLCESEEVTLSVQYNGNSAKVIADGAVPIEFGTAYTPPKPFLVPSLIAQKNDIVTQMAEEIEKAGGMKND